MSLDTGICSMLNRYLGKKNTCLGTGTNENDTILWAVRFHETTTLYQIFLIVLDHLITDWHYSIVFKTKKALNINF